MSNGRGVMAGKVGWIAIENGKGKARMQRIRWS